MKNKSKKEEFARILASVGLAVTAIILATIIIMLVFILYELVTQNAQLAISAMSGLILLFWGAWSVRYFVDRGGL